jgi:hypothetical protein
MGKKKTDVLEGLDDGDPAEIVEGPEGQILYVVGAWNGLPHYRCELCPFDTLDGEEAMVAHYLAMHAPPAPPVPVTIIQVYDRYGNPV